MMTTCESAPSSRRSNIAGEWLMESWQGNCGWLIFHECNTMDSTVSSMVVCVMSLTWCRRPLLARCWPQTFKSQSKKKKKKKKAILSWRSCNRRSASPPGHHTHHIISESFSKQVAARWRQPRDDTHCCASRGRRGRRQRSHRRKQQRPLRELKQPLCVCLNSSSVERVEVRQLLWNVLEWEDGTARNPGVAEISAADGAWHSDWSVQHGC